MAFGHDKKRQKRNAALAYGHSLSRTAGTKRKKGPWLRDFTPIEASFLSGKASFLVR